MSGLIAYQHIHTYIQLDIPTKALSYDLTLTKQLLYICV